MNYTYFRDGCHGYLQVPLSQIDPSDYTEYSFKSDVFAYLEEDCDAPKFLQEHLPEISMIRYMPIDCEWIRNLRRLK